MPHVGFQKLKQHLAHGSGKVRFHPFVGDGSPSAGQVFPAPQEFIQELPPIQGLARLPQAEGIKKPFKGVQGGGFHLHTGQLLPDGLGQSRHISALAHPPRAGSVDAARRPPQAGIAIFQINRMAGLEFIMKKSIHKLPFRPPGQILVQLQDQAGALLVIAGKKAIQRLLKGPARLEIIEDPMGTGQSEFIRKPSDDAGEKAVDSPQLKRSHFINQTDQKRLVKGRRLTLPPNAARELGSGLLLGSGLHQPEKDLLEEFPGGFPRKGQGLDP